MKIKVLTAAIILALTCMTIVNGQRRVARPRAKSPSQPAKPKDEPKQDPNVRVLLHSEDGADYYVGPVGYKPDMDMVGYVYSIVLQLDTPAGRTVLTKLRPLVNLMVADPAQQYYLASVNYVCLVNPKLPDAVSYVHVVWSDRQGNSIAELKIAPEDSGQVQSQAREMTTYSDAYLQTLIDSVVAHNEAVKENFRARMRLAIDTGNEAAARQMKFEPYVPKYLPALSLVIAGGTRYMSEAANAAIARLRITSPMPPANKP